MNDATMRTAARQRLEQAEFAEVLDAPVAALSADRAPRRHAPARHAPTWFAAAAAVAALSVTIWIASTEGDADTTQAQDPDEFDAAAPWHEQFWPLNGYTRVKRTDEAQFLPRNGIRLIVETDLLPEPWLQQLLGSPDLARLWMTATDPDDESISEAGLWQTLAKASNLESLALDGFAELGGEQLRELRDSTSLQHIYLSESTRVADREVGAALAEIRSLRGLAIVCNRVTPEGIDALAKAPNLRHLYFTLMQADTNEMGRALAKLPHLRSLTIHQNSSVAWQDLAFLADLPDLQLLELGELPHGDADLAHLPAGIRSLTVHDAINLTADGVRSLSRLTGLQSLSLGLLTPEQVTALAEVVQGVPLQRFGGGNITSTDALLQALSSRDELRVLEIILQRGREEENLTLLANAQRLERLTIYCATPGPAALRRLAGLQQLERLTISCADAPEPAALQELRGLEKLRVVRLFLRESMVTRRGKDTKKAAALRSCLGPKVEVRLR